ncbi:MAG: hypothetical protein HY776_01615 [Actinobacteria bacterium]|nr:hypothetical protein [Actinomycetota bacterium]
MKKIFIYLCLGLVFGVLVFITGCSSGKEKTEKVSYPVKFECTHGGGAMTIADAKDGDKQCNVCSCGQKKKDCQP